MADKEADTKLAPGMPGTPEPPRETPKPFTDEQAAAVGQDVLSRYVPPKEPEQPKMVRRTPWQGAPVPADVMTPEAAAAPPEDEKAEKKSS